MFLKIFVTIISKNCFKKGLQNLNDTYKDLGIKFKNFFRKYKLLKTLDFLENFL
jgi:hypothetical protein